MSSRSSRSCSAEVGGVEGGGEPPGRVTCPASLLPLHLPFIRCSTICGLPGARLVPVKPSE